MEAPPEVIEAARARAVAMPAKLDFEVWPENWTAVSLFLGLETQWTLVAGAAGLAYVGINYGVVEGQMRRHRIRRAQWPEYWGYLGLMEREALPIKNSRYS